VKNSVIGGEEDEFWKIVEFWMISVGEEVEE
jgi:hypothetical protein